MNRLYAAIAACLCAVGALWAENTHYCLKVGDFNELKLIDGINVNYVANADSAGLAVFDAEPDVVSMMLFSNDKSKLKIQIADEYNPVLAARRLPTLTVYSTFLASVENSGDSTLRVLSTAPGAKFAAKVIGNGRIVVRDVYATQVEASLETGSGTVIVNGRCHNAKLNMTGTGTLQADGLEAQEARVRAFGTGTVGCWATEALTIYGAGTAKIYYKGHPEKFKKRAVSLKIFSLDDGEDTEDQPTTQAEE